MHTGQNSIAPENSLPQLGQVRWGSALMLLIALQSHPPPENNTTFHRLVRNRPAQLLAYCCFIAQAIANYGTLAHQITFLNKIPGAPGLRCSVLIFGDTANRRVSQTTTFNYWQLEPAPRIEGSTRSSTSFGSLPRPTRDSPWTCTVPFWRLSGQLQAPLLSRCLAERHGPPADYC